MCYDVESATLAKLKYALHRGDPNEADELQQKLFDLDPLKFPFYNVSGFAHPKLLVFTNEQPMQPRAFVWGLIPGWVNDLSTAKRIMNQTLNARAETIFEKPSFKSPAKNKRCLIYLDAFYEHHHANGKTYPFRIAMKDGGPMALAGLWDEWVDKVTGEIHHTVSVVTTEANPLMKMIHNNPKAEGPRMPVILPKDKQDHWLIACRSESDIHFLKSLLVPFDEQLLNAYTVSRLKGKTASGNVKESENKFDYIDLLLKFNT